MKDPILKFIQGVQTALAGGKATEHSHRLTLQVLLESLGTGVTVINEPRQEVSDCGKPDMAVFRGEVSLGYLETKDISKNLDVEEKTSQIRRYLKGLSNFILTNYLEFRWYVGGEWRMTASLGRIDPDGRVKLAKDGVAAGRELLGQFLAHVIPSIGTARDLAVKLAGLAHLVREAALATLQKEPETGALTGWLAAFEQTLLPHLSAAEFADMYAQTLAYGLFAARVTVGAGRDVGRDTAARLLPETNPLLKRLFYHLAGPDVPRTVSWVIDDMVALLNATDLEAVLTDFGRGSIEKDPVVHFYETFLAAYDPEKRKIRGVYYTPEPVVSYIVRAIDHVLQERFHRSWGLADRETLILEPACGTGTFLHSIIALTYETLCAQGQAGSWRSYVSDSLLPRLFGFELLMAPYAVAHLKLGLALQARGYDFPAGKRLGIYLTNTLEEALKKSQVLPLAGFITEESNTASSIKQDKPIEVILGNPPYSVHSDNKGDWIRGLVKDYKKVDGLPLGEKNPKSLQDDYVKFLRWGQWRLDRTGQGVLAMITNHGYLDNATFRGMRQAFLKSFNEIYLVNLHGNLRKKEVCPDGSKDENVFDIQQGVAIGIFIKHVAQAPSPVQLDSAQPGAAGPQKEVKVYYADVWGLREAKYQTLAEMDLTSTPWQELQPHSPYYLFVPHEAGLQAEYDRAWPISKIFPVNSVGLVTARDHLTIKWSRAEVWETVRDFVALPEDEARQKYNLGKDVRDWKVHLAQADIKLSGPNRKKIYPILYRPFDTRFTYYTGQTRGFMCRPRFEVMRHLLPGKNLGLCVSRGVEIGGDWEHIFCSRNIIQNHTVSLKEVNYLFPLYLFPSENPNNNASAGQNSFLALSEPESPYGRQVNINPDFLRHLEEQLGLTFTYENQGDRQTSFGPLDVFYYAYATFHSPGYRERFTEFLRIDFPRLPLTGNRTLFAALADRGAELAALHFMESPALEKFITTFPVSGSNIVEKVEYVAQAPSPVLGSPSTVQQGAAEAAVPPMSGRVFINAEQYVAGVSPKVWAFQVGGYQVLHQWLKDRKGRALSFEEIHRYQKIVAALTETIRLMGEIDALIEEHGGWPLG